MAANLHATNAETKDNETNEFIEANKNKRGQKYTHDLLAAFALDFIRRHQQEPFFLYLPFTIPHFNLIDDVAEEHDVAAGHPELVAKFEACLKNARKGVGS